MEIEGEITNGKIKGEITYGIVSESFKGIIEGDVKGKVKKINDKEVLGSFEGKLQKGKIDGRIEYGNFNAGKISEGIIKGVIRSDQDGSSQTIERIIVADFRETNKKRRARESIGDNIGENNGVKTRGIIGGERISFEKDDINGKISTKDYGGIEEESHYNSFKICKMYIESASGSEYQLWPVIQDPVVS